MKRELKELDDTYFYAGQTIWYKDKKTVLKATNQDHFENLFYQLVKRDNEYKAIFYDRDWKKAFHK